MPQVCFWSLFHHSNGNLAKTEIGTRNGYCFYERPDQVVSQELCKCLDLWTGKAIEYLKLNGLFCGSWGDSYMPKENQDWPTKFRGGRLLKLTIRDLDF